MESTPQSTITHNAVIEFASDPDSHRRRAPRERRAHKKKACPAQKGGLKSAGPCQNRIPGATPRWAQNVDFGRYSARKREVFARISEMAVGQAWQRYFAALGVQKLRRGRPGDNRPDRGHRHLGPIGV